MKDDFTRDSFDATKHYSRVMLQQGRVQLDADWNEQTSIVLHYLRTLAADLLGPHAGPADKLGFEIITQAFPSTSLDAKLEELESNEKRRRTLKAALKRGDMIIGPGRYYVAGILAENDVAILYSEQNEDSGIDDIKNRDRPMLVYLDVWEREVIYVEDERIREVALGGPDTCTRVKVMWQVKVLKSQGTADIDCTAADSLAALGTGKLRARARLDKPPVELCVVPPESRYRGAENQLYRVEVHTGGSATGGATFKWSRENGSVVFPIRTLAGATATLETFGRDLRLGLSEGDWVEILDDALVVGETAGYLAQVSRLNGDESSISLTSLANTDLPTYGVEDAYKKHPYLRRWDHAGDLKHFGGALQITETDDIENGWLTLEDGVQISFSKGVKGAIYRIGDYWLIPARTITSNVEWPYERRDNGDMVAATLLAHGPQHAYAPLYLLPDPAGAMTGGSQDCRCRIEPLKYPTTSARESDALASDAGTPGSSSSQSI